MNQAAVSYDGNFLVVDRLFSGPLIACGRMMVRMTYQWQEGIGEDHLGEFVLLNERRIAMSKENEPPIQMAADMLERSVNPLEEE